MTRRSFFNPFAFTTVKLDKDPPTKVKAIEVDGASGTRLYMKAGVDPASTTTDGISWDAVLFLDSDGRLKVRMRDGNTYNL